MALRGLSFPGAQFMHFFLSLERILGWPDYFSKNRFLKVAGWFLVMVQVLVAWVFFRAESIGKAWLIVKTMFSFAGPVTLGWGLNGTVFLTVMFLRELLEAAGVKNRIDWESKRWMWFEMILYALLITSIVYFRGNGSEFIYFQF